MHSLPDSSMYTTSFDGIEFGGFDTYTVFDSHLSNAYTVISLSHTHTHYTLEICTANDVVAHF